MVPCNANGICWPPSCLPRSQARIGCSEKKPAQRGRCGRFAAMPCWRAEPMNWDWRPIFFAIGPGTPKRPNPCFKRTERIGSVRSPAITATTIPSKKNMTFQSPCVMASWSWFSFPPGIRRRNCARKRCKNVRFWKSSPLSRSYCQTFRIFGLATLLSGIGIESQRE